MQGRDKAPFVEGESIGEAYLGALDFILNTKVKTPYSYLTVHISRPILNASTESLPESLNIDDWSKIINLGEAVYKRFSKFNFSKECNRGGSLGKDWINDRILELLHPRGGYYKRLRECKRFGEKFDQLDMVEHRLLSKNKKGEKMHGVSTNALVCQVFEPGKDLERACKPRPQAKGLSCLTELDFKPKKTKLNLFAVFRSQFFDTKAYGNFISLAILLSKMCRKTNYEPGYLVSTANNVTFDKLKSKDQQQNLLKLLRSS